MKSPVGFELHILKLNLFNHHGTSHRLFYMELWITAKRNLNSIIRNVFWVSYSLLYFKSSARKKLAINISIKMNKLNTEKKCIFTVYVYIQKLYSEFCKEKSMLYHAFRRTFSLWVKRYSSRWCCKNFPLDVMSRVALIVWSYFFFFYYDTLYDYNVTKVCSSSF